MSCDRGNVWREDRKRGGELRSGSGLRAQALSERGKQRRQASITMVAGADKTTAATHIPEDISIVEFASV